MSACGYRTAIDVGAAHLQAAVALAARPPALPQGCPVRVTDRVPLAGGDIQPLAIVRCQRLTGQADCDTEIRNAVCRVGGNYAFGVHDDERGVIVATIAVYRPAILPDGGTPSAPAVVGRQYRSRNDPLAFSARGDGGPQVMAATGARRGRKSAPVADLAVKVPINMDLL